MDITRVRRTVAMLAAAAAITPAAAGGFAAPEPTVLYTLRGEAVGDGYGWVAGNLGDLDGDGVSDLIVAAPFRSENGPQSGKVYVYSGATGATLATAVGDAWDRFGWSVASAGDVNADGIPDYVVGGPGTVGAPTPSTGRVTIFSGADHSVLLDRRGASGARLGSAVAGAGDTDGDGHADVLACANFAAASGPMTGRCDLLSGADGAVRWSRGGLAPGDRLGGGAGGIGDVTGDGVPDVVAAAVFAGPSLGGEALVLSGADGAVVRHLRPSPLGAAQVFGLFFASGAGDVDGDGVGDVFVGDYASGYKGPVGTGQAYVFSGADGSMLHRFDADHSLDGVGPGRGVGDVDGDGHVDLIVAAYTASDGAEQAGKVTVFSGADGSVLRTIVSTTPFDNFGVDALGLGDVDGDGSTDFVVTSVGLDFAGLGVGRVDVIAGGP